MKNLNGFKMMYGAYFDIASQLVAAHTSMKLIMYGDGIPPEKAEEMINDIGKDVTEAYEKSEAFQDAQKVFDGKMSLSEFTQKALRSYEGGRR